MIRRLVRVAAGIGIIIGTNWSSISSAANLIANGSFEIAGYSFGADGGADLAPGDGRILGWSVITNHVASLRTGNAYSIVPEDGNISLDLQGYSDGAPYGGVLQVINTTPGQFYDLTFWLSGPGAIVAVDPGEESLSLVNPLTGPGNLWNQYQAFFTAASARTTISLSGVHTGGGDYIGLDNVAVNLVPEPAAVLLSAIGAIGIAILKKQRFSLSRSGNR